MAKTEFIAAIELGSSRAAGIAGRKNSDGSIEILAYAREDAAPFAHKGTIYNIDKAAHALDSLKQQLEQQLGHPVAQVYTGIGGQSLRTVANTVSRTLDEESIITNELVDAITDENLETPYADMCVLDVAPQEYKIDNTLHADPVGVTGTRVTGQFLNIMARTSVKKNLELSFGQAGIALADLLVAPTALAKAVLTEAEMRSGCVLVDFGADTTTLQVYKNNLLRYLCVLPLGGNSITRDIASLNMEEEDAEQLKLAHGNACPNEEEEEPLPIAYTTIIMIGSCANRTPADVLLENPENKTELLKARKWLVENMAKYKKNKEQVAAIDNALELLQVGELKPRNGGSGSMVIYEREMKTSRAVDANGYYTGSDIVITCYFGKKYPWRVQITNYKTKKKLDASGKTIVDAQTIKDKKSAAINLSDDDFIFCVTRMREIVELYQAQEFHALYKRAMAESKKQAMDAKERNADREP